MANFKIFGKNKPKYSPAPSTSDCKCPATMILHFKDKFSDDQTRVYFCINPACGRIFTCLPHEYANQIPEAREYIRKLARELKLPRLDYAPKST